MPKFTADPSNIRDGHISTAELLSRCQAAARLATYGASESWRHEDRLDIAAELCADYLASCAKLPEQLETGKASLATIKGRMLSAKVIRRECVDSVPEPKFSALVGKARNLKRSSDLARERDGRYAAEHAATAQFTSEVPLADPETRGTPHGARMVAVGMLRDLGALGATVEHGPLWSAAYAAARAAAGIDSAEIAEELDISPDTLRQHISRAAKRLPSASTFTQRAHAAMLCVADPMPPAQPRGSWQVERVAGKDPSDWRMRGAEGEITTRTVAPTPSTEPAEWTRGLAPSVQGRLARMAEVREARKAKVLA